MKTVKNKKEINKAFEEAVRIATDTTKKLPPDIRLLLYANYKQATQRNRIVPIESLAENDLRSAFKYNAMVQVKSRSITEAKEEYIELVEKYIKEN